MKINYNDRYKLIGLNIKRIREQNKLTQAQFCEKIGISISYLSKIEAPNCEKSFSLDLLFHISEVMNVNITEFFKS